MTIKTQKATQTEQQINYKVWLDAKYKMRLSNSESNNGLHCCFLHCAAEGT